MKYTILRLATLMQASQGIDYPGTDSVRETLWKYGALQWMGSPPHDNKFGAPVVQRSEVNFRAWRITEKGENLLREWNERHSI
jgi:hypothetical protein